MPEHDIGLLGVPLCAGQGKPGADKGPKVLRDAGVSDRLKSLGYSVTDYGDLEFNEVEHDPTQFNMNNPSNVGNANKKIADAVCEIVSSGKTCITLGGDHSLAIGSVAGHAAVNPDLALIWVDAHADLNPPMASHSGNIHGMPVAFLLKELTEYIPRLDAFKWLTPCLTAKDIVYIGLRDVDAPEKYIIDKLGIKAFTMRDVDRLGIVRVVEEALAAVNPDNSRPIHLSFDVDALDPNVTPSTGTPVPGGLTIREGIYIAEEVALTGKLAVMDVVEVNPDLGNDKDKDVTLYTSLEVITSCFKDMSESFVHPEKFELPMIARINQIELA